MKVTDEMSNADINLEIAKLRYSDCKIQKAGKGFITTDVAVRSASTLNPIVVVNYTENIADIFPIMVELGVSIEKVHFGVDYPYFVTKSSVGMVGNTNAIRAIAECVLLALRE